MSKKTTHFFQPTNLGKSLKAFLLAAIFGMILIISFVQPLDGDTWWHLRAGEETYLQGKPLTVDLFSYTRYGEAWASHGWLTELWLYLTYLIGGFTGLTIWIALLNLIIVTFVYYQMEGPPLYRAILVLLMSLLLLPFLKARPQMMTLVFFLLTIWIMRNYLNHKRDLTVWLIPVFILWANFHGGFVVGFLFIIISIVGDQLGRVFNTPKIQPLNRKQLIKLSVVILLCAIAVMIHPLGINTWTTLYHTMNVGGEGANIVEWASPDFHDPFQQLYLWFLLVVLSVLAITPRKISITDLLLFCAFTGMGFIWRRNLSLMLVYGMILLSGFLWAIISELFEKRHLKLIHSIGKVSNELDSRMQLKTPVFIYVFLMMVVAFIIAGAEIKAYLITDGYSIAKWEKQLFPERAKEWIQENRPEGNMMNSYNWGGYFEWYLRDHPIFLDSRADLFGNEIIYQWLQVMDAKEGWQDVLSQWQIKFIVIEPSWKIADLLPYHGWSEYYRDEQAVIYGISDISTEQK